MKKITWKFNARAKACGKGENEYSDTKSKEGKRALRTRPSLCNSGKLLICKEKRPEKIFKMIQQRTTIANIENKAQPQAGNLS